MIFDGYRVGVLCEDTTHYNFIRGFLGILGVQDRKIDLVAELPEGKMSGEQFVRDRFPVALKEYARDRENKFLAVVQDVDRKNRFPEDMRALLKDVAERNSAVGGIKEGDKFFFVFPKKNIETWIRWANAADEVEKANVTEEEDYKTDNRVKPKRAGKTAGEIYQKRKSSSSIDVLPSLNYMYDSLDSLRKCLGVW